MWKNKFHLIILLFTLSTVTSHAAQNPTCDTERLINCQKNAATLSIEEKAECSTLSSACQSSAQEGDSQTQKTTYHPCKDVCSPEKLLKCTKNYSTLSLQQQAFCTKMTDNCKDCPKE